ncbi:MAG: hypothetical protein ACK5M5_04860, partial [Limnobaculum xujianqingii]
ELNEIDTHFANRNIAFTEKGNPYYTNVSNPAAAARQADEGRPAPLSQADQFRVNRRKELNNQSD